MGVSGVNRGPQAALLARCREVVDARKREERGKKVDLVAPREEPKLAVPKSCYPEGVNLHLLSSCFRDYVAVEAERDFVWARKFEDFVNGNVETVVGIEIETMEGGIPLEYKIAGAFKFSASDVGKGKAYNLDSERELVEALRLFDEVLARTMPGPNEEISGIERTLAQIQTLVRSYI